MGLLQRLEREARAARQRRSEDAAVRQTRDAHTSSRLTPALDRAARYFDALVAHLGDLEMAIHARYEVGDVGVLEGLEQTPCRVTRTDAPRESVQLRFSCTGPNPLETTVDNHARGESIARNLREFGLTCKATPLSAKKMRLRVDANVPVRISFVPDVTRGQVQVELRNLTALGVERYPLPPERIDEELLDALASLMLREPSNFADLTGSVVAAEDRAELQRRLARERRRHDAELAGGLRGFVFPFTEWFRRQFLGG